ncbi:hypothetical protein IQ251_12775 [Saccharopolyspora sp. HNM0983]|uniref:Uncharacterized protein n=1 Tax=Saccharopolyspora montiporae TaxID=2781240 RepID=A0A929B8R5_9PSEU|nr:hypothetical protein [Saccharopolyspora sp. HNM0983]MBE9375319.1 hypothetical protein [Saccharopolyspora sp. HNM0983]
MRRPVGAGNGLWPYPEVLGLRSLANQGWVLRELGGERGLLGGFRWRCAEDLLWVPGRDHAFACRVVRSTGAVVWEVPGTLARVLAELHALPFPGHPRAPHCCGVADQDRGCSCGIPSTDRSIRSS